MKPRDIAKLVQSGELKPFGLETPTGERIVLPWRSCDKPGKLQKLERINFLRLTFERFDDE